MSGAMARTCRALCSECYLCVALGILVSLIEIQNSQWLLSPSTNFLMSPVMCPVRTKGYSWIILLITPSNSSLHWQLLLLQIKEGQAGITSQGNARRAVALFGWSGSREQQLRYSSKAGKGSLEFNAFKRKTTWSWKTDRAVKSHLLCN